VLAATGVVWEACDALLKTCQGGVVDLVVKKAQEWRSTLLDAVEELKEWGDDDEEDAEDSHGEDDDFADEDAIFSAANKLGKDNENMKELLEKTLKKLKMVGILYQALIKRRLKTFPRPVASPTPTDREASKNGVPTVVPVNKLDELLDLLKAIPETVDDLASAFYDLDEDEAKQTLDKCCQEAKQVVNLAKQNWSRQDDEFTAWSTKWVDNLESS
jgi:translation elongation factor EF-G